MDLVLSFSLPWIWFCLAFLEALLFIYSAEVKKIRLSWSKLSAFAINCRDVCVTSPRACWKCISLHNSVFWGRAVRCSAGLGFSMSAFLLAAYAQGASRGQNCAKGTSLFIFTIFLESFGERGKTGMFMKVSRWSALHPQLFFSVLEPWRINQSQW